MIKVSCTVGSAKNNGSCAYVVDGFIDGIGGKAEVKRYFIGDINVNSVKVVKTVIKREIAFKTTTSNE